MSMQDGQYKYTTGNFVSFNEASTLKSELRKNGYEDAFVVAFFNDKKITLNEAKALQK